MSYAAIAGRGPASSRGIRLDTLIGLRWLAIAGQTAAILTVGFLLGFEMPVGICFAVTALSAWLNLFLKLRYPSSLRLRDGQAAMLLGYDMLQLAALLYLTGGLRNPFALLLVVPAIVSATALPVRFTLRLGVLALAASTLLWLVHLPLPWPAEEMIELPPLYVAGIWVAVLCVLMFAGFYAFRVSDEARQLATALAATELVLERERHLSALDGLAAAAAHELGTPLATIALVAREMQREVPTGTPLANDIALLVSQAQRCRDILGRLTSLSTSADWIQQRQRLTHLLAEAIEPYQGFGPAIRISVDGEAASEPIAERNPAILYGLGNLIENAVDFAGSGVDIRAEWTPNHVAVVIADDGPGFAAEIIDRIGDPYVTTRARAPEKDELDAGGLGLGFFIAKTLLERSGATLKLSNRPAPATGAVVEVTWPRAAYGTGVPNGNDADIGSEEPVGSAEEPALYDGRQPATGAAGSARRTTT